MIKNFLQKTIAVFKQQTGSTLIELIIAVMVVGLVITAVANTATHSVKNSGEARYKQVATALGQEAIEFIRGEKNRLGLINLKNNLITADYCFSSIPSDLENTSQLQELIFLEM